MSQYRATILTPTLVGDGGKLAPIDYMVWKDQVNVLDQRRIFKLLAKGSRLDSYLSQIKRVDKLDFASWGGYAQNYALRRIPLEDPALAEIHSREKPENLFIPTFCSALQGGAFLPATALKGPLRTALASERLRLNHVEELAARIAGADRPPRSPGLELETSSLGSGGFTRTRSLQLTDSASLPAGSTRVYLLRTATLVDRGKSLELGWKTAARGSVDAKRVQDSLPVLAEMAVPGSAFVGHWRTSLGLQHPQMLQMLRWKDTAGPIACARSANTAAEILLSVQQEFAQTAGLGDLLRTVEALKARLAELRSQTQSCLLCIGWGTGYLSKTLLSEGSLEAFRNMLRTSSLYGSAIRSGLPFPKTRRVVFLKNRPASLPGWVQLDFLD